MLSTIIFCIAVFLAALSVLLLAIFSPVPHRNQTPSNTSIFTLSLYIQQPIVPLSNSVLPSGGDAGALIFHRVLTEGPENTSDVIGKAQGFIVPLERFANSAFNVIYLTFSSDRFYGSLSVEAGNFGNKEKLQKLKVVGGTGSFAFARGVAVFAETGLPATYHVKLYLQFPNKSQTIISHE